MELHPSSICLPVFQCNEDNYNLYAEEGGSGECEEEGWSNGPEAEARGVLREALLHAEANKVAGIGGVEAEVADPITAEARAQFTSAGVNKGGAVVHAPERTLPDREADVSAGERERRRKGKGIMPEANQGANQARKAMRVSEYNSGSDSWDPINAGARIANEDSSFSSKDANSRAQAEGGQVGYINRQQLNDEDMDMGGEGGERERGATIGDKGMRVEQG